MAKQVFWRNLMSSEFDGAKLVGGKFYNEADEASDIHDGAIVVVGDLEDSVIYDGVKEYNVRKITAPESETDDIAIVDVSNVTAGEIAGVTYRDGIKGTGLIVEAKKPARVRRVEKGDTFWLATGNFESEPVIGQYAVPTAGSTLLTPSADKVVGATCVKIEYSKPLIEGAVNTDTMYLCTVVSVA